MGLTKPHFLDEIWKGLLSLGESKRKSASGGQTRCSKYVQSAWVGRLTRPRLATRRLSYPYHRCSLPEGRGEKYKGSAMRTPLDAQ